MKFIYVDNFRGFTDTLIPIREVSFMVGENSTGKTSILSLFRALSSPRFWFNFDFDVDDVRLGHFKDIVSINSSDPTYFRVGFAEPFPKQPQDCVAFLLTFVERDGMPQIQKYSFVSGDFNVTVRFSRRRIAYKFEKRSPYTNFETYAATQLRAWRAEHSREITGLSTFPIKERRSGMDLYDVVFFIQKKLKQERHRFPFFQPVDLSHDLVWVAPIRSKPHRTYDEYKFEFSSEGEHTPYLIRKILATKSEAAKFSTFIERIGKTTGLFEAIAVKRYGRTMSSPFELDVVINSKALSVSNVGYGVSQSLPVFVELFSRTRGSWFAIQQPEIHLHPRAQAAMGDVIYELATSENKAFLVESHSDYLIDRYRLSLKAGKQKPSSQILYFARDKAGNNVHCIRIHDDGQLATDQPRSYRDFFIREQVRNLELDDVYRN